MRLAKAPPTAVALILLGLQFPVGAAGASPTPALPDSARIPLPFEPATEPGESFAASKLNRTYAKDLTRLLRADAQRHRTDLELLDRYAEAPPPALSPAALDSSDIRLVGSRPEGSPTELTPQVKQEAKPPQAGVQVGIPSPVAASATILGGIALFIKVLSEFLK